MKVEVEVDMERVVGEEEDEEWMQGLDCWWWSGVEWGVEDEVVVELELEDGG